MSVHIGLLSIRILLSRKGDLTYRDQFGYDLSRTIA